MSRIAMAMTLLYASTLPGCSMTSNPAAVDAVPETPATTIDTNPSMTATGHPDGASSWQIEPSPTGSPLQSASLSGRSRFAGIEAASTLVVGCRAEADGSTLTLAFTVPASSGFDFAAWEGPDGIGQRHPLLQVGEPDAAPTRHRVGGGWSQPGTFMFSAKQPIDPGLLADLVQWPQQAGRELRFAILSMEKNASPDRILTARFVLPDDAAALSTVMSSCR